MSHLLSSCGQAGLLQRPLLGSRATRAVCRPLCAKQKGKQGGGNVKVNKRGKVSSRPGPGSPALAEAQQQMQQQQQQQQQAQGAQQEQQQQPAVPSLPAAAGGSSSSAQPQQQAPAGGARPALTETPQVVVDRMFSRAITFAGLPVLLGILLFPAFWYLRVVQKVEYPLWIVYVTQAMMFGGGLLGISYGILSTSWDPAREGTALGWQEFRANLPILLNRSKQQQQ